MTATAFHSRLATLNAAGEELGFAEQGQAETVAEARNEVALYGDSWAGSAAQISHGASLKAMRAAFDALLVAFVDDFPEFGPTVPASHIIADEPF